MEQTIPGTCAIVACTVCVEAVHRLEHDKLHGEGTFKWSAALSALDRLFIACILDATWTPANGANVGKVLTKIQQMGGVLATSTAPYALQLPLRSWRRHTWHDGSRLSPERVAALLDSHGPCVGVLWVCPWYYHFDARGHDDALVYSGCGRGEDDREQSKRLYPGTVGSHAVVCFAYRFCSGGGDEMHVLVRDNHEAAANGPQRWIDVEEIDTLYTLSVERA
nr:unnamed protein product [Digitaria exilis]